jgi:hypothetical protein
LRPYRRERERERERVVATGTIYDNYDDILFMREDGTKGLGKERVDCGEINKSKRNPTNL